MWQSLEASRYAECNPEYGRTDVDLAVKLLVPIDVAEDAEALKRLWNIKSSPHYEGSEMFSTRFVIVPHVTSSSSSAASLGSSRGRTPSPAQAPEVPPLSPRPAAAAGVLPTTDFISQGRHRHNCIAAHQEVIVAHNASKMTVHNDASA